MRVKDLQRQLAQIIAIWPHVIDKPVTINNLYFDLAVPVDAAGNGPQTCSNHIVESIVLMDSGLSASDFERHG